MNEAPSVDEMLIAGDEPVEELRRLIGIVSTRCPLGKTHERCPFRMFGLLMPKKRDQLIAGMTVDACLYFFELERECRASASCAQNKASDDPFATS